MREGYRGVINMDGCNEWELVDLYDEAERKTSNFNKVSAESTLNEFNKLVQKREHEYSLDKYKFNGGN